MKIFLGADHGGYEMKEELKKWLVELEYEVEDKGAMELDEEDDFVGYAEAVAEGLQQSVKDMGIVLCRNGVGVSMAANRFVGVRCALGFDGEQVRRARADDDVNCLALPSDYVDMEKAKKLAETFLKTKFSGEERFKRRLAKLAVVGGAVCKGGVCVPKYAQKT